MTECPRCGLTNTATSLRCDCGFDLGNAGHQPPANELRRWWSRTVDRFAGAPRTLSAYSVYLGIGIISLWMLLVPWGFSRGPSNIAPYVELLGLIILVLVGAPLALFFEKLAAVIASIAAAIVVAAAILAVALSDPNQEGLASAAVMAVIFIAPVAIASYLVLRRVRSVPWTSRLSMTRPLLTCVLTALPYVVFFFLFDGRLILRILWGPWKTA